MRRVGSAFAVVAWCIEGAVRALLAASAVLACDIARAQAADSASARVVFVLHDPSPAASVLTTFDSMQGQLGELDVDLEAVRLDHPPSLEGQAEQAAEAGRQRGAAAVFWFEGSGARVRVYALHGPSGRVYARDVDLSADSALQREALAVVLRAAVPAMLEPDPPLGDLVHVVGPARPEAPPRDVVPRAAAAPRSTVEVPRESSPRVRAAVGYDGTSLAERAWQSGARGEVLLDAGRWARVGLSSAYGTPVTVHGADAGATITRVPVAVLAGVRWSAGRVAGDFEAGGLVEGWRRRSTVRSDTLEPTAPSTTFRAGAWLGARGELALGSTAGLFAVGAVELLPAPHTLSVQTGSTEERLPTQQLRPRLTVGASFDLSARDKKPATRNSSTPSTQPGH